MGKKLRLLELINALSELGLEVSSLVSMDDTALSELIEHLCCLGEHSCSLSLISGLAEIANEITHRLCIITIKKIVLLSLANSLQGRLVVCHFVCCFKVLQIGHSRYPVTYPCLH